VPYQYDCLGSDVIMRCGVVKGKWGSESFRNEPSAEDLRREYMGQYPGHEPRVQYDFEGMTKREYKVVCATILDRDRCGPVAIGSPTYEDAERLGRNTVMPRATSGRPTACKR
jgi:hypothetical protein